MSIRDQLIRKALVALDELAERAVKEPIAPSFAIRFVLAFLYTTGRGERWMHDAFWREMQRPNPEGRATCFRGTDVRTALNGIMLNAGVPPSVQTLHAMRDERTRQITRARQASD